MSGGSQIFFGAATPACWTVNLIYQKTLAFSTARKKNSDWKFQTLILIMKLKNLIQTKGIPLRTAFILYSVTVEFPLSTALHWHCNE